jgi:DNA-binding transcriptional regulator YiaG
VHIGHDVVEPRPVPKITPTALVRLREPHHLSRALFPRCLRTNARSLENWEQGRAKPNAQASVLVGPVSREQALVSVPTGPARSRRIGLWPLDKQT